VSHSEGPVLDEDDRAALFVEIRTLEVPDKSYPIICLCMPFFSEYYFLMI
jgi:hypothetical protein